MTCFVVHQGKQASQQWVQTLLGVKENYFQHKKHQEGLDPKGEVRSQWTTGNLET
jgi:hypothetical protein